MEKDNAFSTMLTEEQTTTLVAPRTLFVEVQKDTTYILADNVQHIDYGNDKQFAKFLFVNENNHLVTFNHWDLQHFNWMHADKMQTLLDLNPQSRTEVAVRFKVLDVTPRTRSNGDLIYPMQARAGYGKYVDNVRGLTSANEEERKIKRIARKILFATDLVDGAKPLSTITTEFPIFVIKE